tara:strand:- start:119 stop:310 length:192 start_codon:yes stop_codon:yes gene_type:complete
MTRHIETVKGHRLPAPRLTRTAWRLIVLLLILPFLLFLGALDLVFYAIAHYAFEHCYGIECWL